MLDYDYQYHTPETHKVYGIHIASFSIFRLFVFIGFIVYGVYTHDYTFDWFMIMTLALIGFMCSIGSIMGILHIFSQTDYLDISSPNYRTNIASYYLVNYVVSIYCVFLVVLRGNDWGLAIMLLMMSFTLITLIDIQLFVDRLNCELSRNFMDYVKLHYSIYLPMVMLFMGTLVSAAFINDLSSFTKISYSVVFSVTLIDYLMRQCICTYPMSDKSAKVVYLIEYLKYSGAAFLPYGGKQTYTYLIAVVYLLWKVFIFISMYARRNAF